MRFTSRSALTCKVLKMIGESQSSPGQSTVVTKYPMSPGSVVVVSFSCVCRVFCSLGFSLPFRFLSLLIPPSSFSHLQVPGREDGQDASNLGFFPRLGFRADSISRQCGDALSPPRREEA